MLVNYFNKRTGFFQYWPIEADVRFWADTYHNSYHIVIFACCRELESVDRHRGFFGGTKEEAKEHYGAIRCEKEEIAKAEASVT